MDPSSLPGESWLRVVTIFLLLFLTEKAAAGQRFWLAKLYSKYEGGGGDGTGYPRQLWGFRTFFVQESGFRMGICRMKAERTYYQVLENICRRRGGHGWE